ncbi:unnamed protein product [Brachionus calyciflorus]|uniref:Uncharacterized protein n=1 Tax=Brachionus calyciflorus TaxID=104777 RepID=A0A813YKK5_9BILA|nr:unnamed protein product [Brachionus calyciflorus]
MTKLNILLPNRDLNDDNIEMGSNSNPMSSLKNLFPTKISFFVFIAYMALFINQGLLVTASKNKDNKFNYNPITVVLLTELLKLIFSSVAYLKNNSLQIMWEEIGKNYKIFLKYFIPSFLYCLYNNLTFVNLSSYDPTTYFLLLQFRVVVTGVVFQILFSKRLSKMQWISLLLLTAGCIIKQISYSKTNKTSDTLDSDFNLNEYVNSSLILILVQVFSSCFAGVYNEYILKEKDNNVDMMLQNVFMYIDSIICNVLLLCLYVPKDGTSGGLVEAFTYESLSKVFYYKVVLIMVNNAAIGIVTSFFLKNLNSILKTFASALELMFTGVLAWIIFDIPLDSATIIAIGIVSFATWLYSKNPVQNPPQNTGYTSVAPTDKNKTHLNNV